MAAQDLIVSTERGLYCAVGDFYIDPWSPVPRAVITHGHADHARPGCGAYITASPGRKVLQARVGASATISDLPYGEGQSMNGVHISFHPAGHILGSAQVRAEYRGKVTVVTGDYSLQPTSTCTPFESVRCHTFITESTFALPIYRWPSVTETYASINNWWAANREAGRPSLLFGYALGKAQRLLAGVNATIGPIYTHGAVERMTQVYRDSGIVLPHTQSVVEAPRSTDWGGALVIAPPSAQGSMWTRRFGAAPTAFASGWMRIRGARRRRAVDRGFVASDHVDWPGLLQAISMTGAERVVAVHGYTSTLARWLRERGLDTGTAITHYEEENEDAEEASIPDGHDQ